ncbi:MAG: hypothetical protein IJT32_06895, partial [Lachnospiraceae bacterium]|nr:hypothetical protein [Lachnospiraceae bacterium]
GFGGGPGGQMPGENSENTEETEDVEHPERPEMTEEASGDDEDEGSGEAQKEEMTDAQEAQTSQMKEEAQRNDSAENTEETEEASGDDEDEKAEEEDEETYVKISGGALTIINENARDADGIDSNGDIYITGGTIRVSLAGGGTNCAIDYASENGGVCEISGGTVIAAGGSGMVEKFDETSTQCSILYMCSTDAGAGTAVTLKDAGGNELLSWEVPCSFSSVIISCPEMQVQNTYTLLIGDSSEEITLEEVSASAGEAQSGGFPGMNGGDFGGHGMGMHRSSDSEDDAASESEDEGFGNGFPAPPDFNPEDGDFPAPPDFNTQDGEANGQAEGARDPEANGQAEGARGPEANGGSDDTQDGDSSKMGHGGPGGIRPEDLQEDDDDEEEEEQEAVSTGISLSEVDEKSWKLLGATAAVLIAGLGFAFFYRKR